MAARPAGGRARRRLVGDPYHDGRACPAVSGRRVGRGPGGVADLRDRAAPARSRGTGRSARRRAAGHRGSRSRRDRVPGARHERAPTAGESTDGGASAWPTSESQSRRGDTCHRGGPARRIQGGRASGATPGCRHRAGRRTVDRTRTGAGGRHRRVRRSPGGGRPPRLRGQRLARAEDPGHGDRPARRGGARRRRRPGARAVVRRKPAARVDPARHPGHRADRAVRGRRARASWPRPRRWSIDAVVADAVDRAAVAARNGRHRR